MYSPHAKTLDAQEMEKSTVARESGERALVCDSYVYPFASLKKIRNVSTPKYRVSHSQRNESMRPHQ